MQRQSHFLRAFFFLFLLACLLTWLVGTIRVPANAAPMMAPPPPHVVISEFRFLGPQGGNDEFIELYNASGSAVNISGWRINASNNAGGTGTRLTVPAVPALQPGQYFLIVNANASAGLLALQDVTYATGVTDDGGIALLDGSNNIVDQVGLSAGSAYKEGTPLSPLSGTANQSYERKTAGNAGNCNDTDDNSVDFVWNQSTSNPQNSSSQPVACLVVTTVTSTAADLPVTHTTGAVIPITVTFSGVVNVTGAPTLLLETGATDRTATYSGGDGTNTLTFTYTVAVGDFSNDLDYVATDSLALNGGTITGAIGNATLVLPTPGTPGSLSANKDIAIDNGIPPSTVSFRRQTPTSPITNANSLTFRVTFSEAVSNVDAADFVVTGTTGAITAVTPPAGSVYDVTVTGGDLANLNGTVGLNLSGVQNIADVVGSPLPPAEPPVDEIYTIDNVAPTVTIEQAAGQPDPDNSTPVNFTVVFSEPIDTSTFTVTDITEIGSANFITWSITDSGDQTNFTLSATAIAQNGDVIPSIAANRVTDLAGNNNTASTSTDNVVNFNDNVPPTVTINQASGQADPTSTLPIRFDVQFSEPINTSLFATTDITQATGAGYATGITWSITDSGDHTNFILSATASGYGILRPSIAANRVQDVAGNPNTASTSTDNSVTFVIAPTNTPSPTPTRTPTPGVCGVGAPPISIIINEIAWGGTGASTSDEWIELYNPTSGPINLDGWNLRALDGTPNISLANFDLGAGQFYLLERSADTVVSDVPANQIFTGDIGNSGEVLQLYNSSGVCVDTANSNGGAWPAGTSSSTFYSMERRGVVSDSDSAWFTNVNAASWTKHDARGTSSANFLIHGTPGYANWAFSVTATPSPIPSITKVPTKFRTATPLPPPPPPLIAINEFVPRPGHDWNNDGVINVGDEYIELLNHGVIPVTLSGYTLDDEVNIGSTPFPLPAVTLQPGERIVFYGSQTGLLLSDGGDGVRLLKPNGQLGDAYNYTVVRHPDQSYCRLPDNGGLDDWNENCFPTPGLKNALGGNVPNPPASGGVEPLCPISDTLPRDFILAECPPFGNIWSRFYWDEEGWLGEKILPDVDSQWDVFVD